MNGNQERRVEHIVDKTFEADGIAVQVTKTVPGRPFYSIKVGTMRQGKKDGEAFVAPFLPIRVEGKGKRVVRKVSGTMCSLVEKAEEYIQSESQILEDAWIKRSIEFGERKDNKDQKKPRPGLSGGPGSGKTQRRREAKRAQVQVAASK